MKSFQTIASLSILFSILFPKFSHATICPGLFSTGNKVPASVFDPSSADYKKLYSDYEVISSELDLSNRSIEPRETIESTRANSTEGPWIRYWDHRKEIVIVSKDSMLNSVATYRVVVDPKDVIRLADIYFPVLPVVHSNLVYESFKKTVPDKSLVRLKGKVLHPGAVTVSQGNIHKLPVISIQSIEIIDPETGELGKNDLGRRAIDPTR